jgi:hypothetical protein
VTGVLVFLLALPLSVYLIAGVLAIIDSPSRSRALAGFTLRLGIFALLVAITPAQNRLWIGAAFLTVLVLHAATTAGIRYAIRSGRWPTERVD